MSSHPDSMFHQYAAELTRLAAAQIRAALIESNSSVDELSSAFTHIVEQDKKIRGFIDQLPDSSEAQLLKNTISEHAKQIGSHVHKATIAFQFYDRLCQKLDHSSELLRQLSEIEDKESITRVDEAISLKQSIFDKFTMKEERQLFDAVLSTDNFEQAIENYRCSRNSVIETDEEKDIEFF